jgi:N-sulfoglucosamine sulfohydrolase
MKTTLTLLTALLLAPLAALPASGPDETAPRPNVLLIVSEDNGPELGCYGDRFSRTPHLDRLATSGLRFDRAYVTQAGCSQSRSSILTGLYPHQNGQIALASHLFRMFSADTPNLPATLRAVGYRTGVIGKIHVLPENAFGFEKLGSSRDNSFANRDVRAVAREAASFIAASAGRPFFLMVNYSDAHLPWRRQQHGLPEGPLSGADVAPLPYVGLRTPEVLKGTADYYNCIARLDTGVGALIAELEKSGRAADTLVIYLADHGAQMPRGKMTSYEGGVRIPLLVAWPGRLPAGIADRRLVSTIDIFPTILAACRVPALASLPGRSLLPGSARDPAPPWREYLFTEFTAHLAETYFPSRTVRDERFKLIVNLTPDRPNPLYHYYTEKHPPAGRFDYGFDYAALPSNFHAAFATFAQPPRFELYDLDADPHELRNLGNDPAYAAEISRLHRILVEWQERTGDELRHPEKLARLTRDIEATFVNGKFQKPPPDFVWPYLRYLAPNP